MPELILTNEVNPIRTLVNIIGNWAIDKGWNENQDAMEPRQLRMYKAEKIALMHTELSECMEFLRKKGQDFCPACMSTGTTYAKVGAGFCCTCCSNVEREQCFLPAMDDKVPSLTGEAAELADTVIRILHYCHEFGIDLGEAIRLKHNFNVTRPHRHGKLA